MKIAFRTDGGPQIGMGHIIRCLALAEDLRKRGNQIAFISRVNDPSYQLIKEKDFEIYSLLNLSTITQDKLMDEIKVLNEYLIKYSPDIVITDSYDITPSYLEEIKQNCELLVSIDDLAEIEFCSDIIVNGNLKAEQLNYKTNNPKLHLLLGPDYVLLRRRFKELHKKQKNFDHITNILVSMGGGDPNNITPKVIKALSSISENILINVVIGPAFENIDHIKSIVKENNREFKILKNPNNIADLMFQAQLAVSGGGTSLYELAACGTPSIVLCQAKNQFELIEALDKYGIIINLGYGWDIDEEIILKTTNKLLDDPNSMRLMSDKGRKLVDGKGVYRVTEEILNSL